MGLAEHCPTGGGLGGLCAPDHEAHHLKTVLGMGRRLTVVVGPRAIGGAGRDWISTSLSVAENPQEVTMFQALSNGIVGIWNYAIPGAVKVVNDVLHAVYEPTHQAIHALADVLTIVMK